MFKVKLFTCRSIKTGFAQKRVAHFTGLGKIWTFSRFLGILGVTPRAKAQFLKVRQNRNNFSSQCFLQKTNKHFQFYYYETCFGSFFWRKLKIITKKHFKINWPLGEWEAMKIKRVFLYFVLHLLVHSPSKCLVCFGLYGVKWP